MDDRKTPDNDGRNHRGNERVPKKVEATAPESQGNESDDVRPVNMGDVNLSMQHVRDIHVGTSAVFNGPVILKGLSEIDIVTNERCICECTKTNKNRSKSKQNIDEKKIRGFLSSKRLKNKESSTGNNKTNKSISKNIKINNGRSKKSKESECNIKGCTVNRCLIFAIVILCIQIIIMFYLKFLNVKNFAYDPCVIDKWNSNEPKTNFTVFSKSWNGTSSWGESESEENEIYYSPRNYSKGTNDCSFECHVKKKSSVKFVVSELYLSCISYDGCIDVLSTEYRAHRSEGWFQSEELNDIYFNYLVLVLKFYKFTFRAEFFRFVLNEGRPLHCPHDESFLDDNHGSKLIIGIPFCFPGNSSENQIFNKRLFPPIEQIFKNLIKMGILEQNPVLELPIFCNNTLLLQKSSENYNITFYEEVDYFDQVKNLSIANTLLFSRKLSVPEFAFDKFYSVHDYKDMLGITNPFPYGNLTRSNPFDNETITIKFVGISFFCEKEDVSCYVPKQIVANNINKSCGDSVNYFMFLDFEIVYEGAPLECLLANNNSVIILVIRNFGKRTDEGFYKKFDELPDAFDFLYRLHRKNFSASIQLLQPIVNHLNSKVNYKNIKFEIECSLYWYHPTEFLAYLYRLLTDDIITRNC